MIDFVPKEKKGLNQFLFDQDINPDELSVHISEVGPGQRSHPPHKHGGLETFYVFEGNGTVEVDDERLPIGPNEAILIDPTKLHGIVNTGSVPMRYMVIISRS